MSEEKRAPADRYVAGIFSTLDLTPSASEPLRDLARHHATLGGINEAFAAHLASAGMSEAVREGLDRILGRVAG